MRFGTALAGLLIFCTAPLYAAVPAKVIALEGSVQVRANDKEDWHPLHVDDTLAISSQVLSGPDGSCQIALGDEQKSVVGIQPNSLATLESLDPVKVALKSGRLFAMVKSLKKGSLFQVSSPTAIAAARGTGWGQDAHSVSVFENTVHVTGNSGREADIEEHHGVHTDDNGNLTDFFDVPEDAAKEWSDFAKSAEGNVAPASEPQDSPEDQSLSEEVMGDSKELTDEAMDQKEVQDEINDGGGHY